jgi:hypothetical protein
MRLVLSELTVLTVPSLLCRSLPLALNSIGLVWTGHTATARMRLYSAAASSLSIGTTRHQSRFKFVFETSSPGEVNK